MAYHTFRKRRLTKTVSSIVSAVFLLSSVGTGDAFAQTQAKPYVNSEKLAAQSPFRPLDKAGYAIGEWARIDAISGLKLLLKLMSRAHLPVRRSLGEGESVPYSAEANTDLKAQIKKINLAMKTLFEARKRAIRRESWASEGLNLGALQFTNCFFGVTPAGKEVVAEFTFTNSPKRAYQITYNANGEYEIGPSLFAGERFGEMHAVSTQSPLPIYKKKGVLVRASSSGEVLPKVSQIFVSASLLSVPDPALFAEKAIEAVKAGADFIHFDVVDGKKGKSALIEEGSIDTTGIFTPEKLSEIKNYGRRKRVAIPIDVHLIVMEPSESYIKRFIDAGANYVSLHWEAFHDKNELLERLKFIEKLGTKAGIAIRPDADIMAVGKFITAMGVPYIDMISQTTIYPCYEGQIFAYRALENIRMLRHDFGLECPIAVDGGVESELASKKAIEAGANFIIAGSAFFGDGKRTFKEMKAAARSLKDQSAIPCGSVYDIIADKILQLRKTKKGKLWVRIPGYHCGGKSVTVQRIVESLRAKDGDQSIIDFPQDDFWSGREEREERRGGGDPTYKNGRTHLRMSDLNMAIKALEKADGDVTFNNIYDFDSGAINGVRTYNLREDSIIIIEGTYLNAVAKKDFDLACFIETNIEAAKARAMERDSVRVRRDPNATRELYEDVYEPTYRDYVKRYKPRESADVVLDTTTINNPRIVDSRQPLKLLECTTCHRQYTPESRISRCISCGGDLQFDIKGPVDFGASIVKSDRSMWRYRKLLPVKDDAIVTAGEGNTPVIYLEDLSRELGVEFYVKLESANPTGTFKDREASFVVSRSRQLGQNDIVMQSTGNTGISISYYAGLAGMRSYFFGPLLSRYKLLMPEKNENAKIILVDGEPADVKAAAVDFALIHNFPKVSPFSERCEANATQGYEIAEKILDNEIPNFDFYVQTIAAGTGPIGFFAGMERVSRWTGGKVKIPRIVAVQISEFAPIQEAWEDDREQVGAEGFTPRFASDKPFEPTLHTTNAPAYYPFIRKLLKDSDGILTKVEPEEVLAHEKRLRESLRRHGVELTTTENSSFVGYAGLLQQIAKGAIPKGSKVVMMVTGKGAKSYIKAMPDAVITPGYDPEVLLKELREARASSAGSVTVYDVRLGDFKPALREAMKVMREREDIFKKHKHHIAIENGGSSFRLTIPNQNDPKFWLLLECRSQEPSAPLRFSISVLINHEGQKPAYATPYVEVKRAKSLAAGMRETLDILKRDYLDRWAELTTAADAGKPADASKQRGSSTGVAGAARQAWTALGTSWYLWRLNNLNKHVRSRAATRLRWRKDPRAKDPLKKTALADEEPNVRNAAAQALCNYHGEDVTDTLITILGDTDRYSDFARAIIAEEFGRRKDPRTIPVLIATVSGKSGNEATSALGEFDGSRVIESLISRFRNGPDSIVAARALVKKGWKPEELNERIQVHLVAGDYTGLAEIGAPVVPRLKEILKESPIKEKIAAAKALKILDDPRAISSFATILRGAYDHGFSKEEAELWNLARNNLLGTKNPDSEEPLKRAMADNPHQVRLPAALGLDNIEWHPRNINEEIAYNIALRKWDKLAELGASTVPALIGLVGYYDIEFSAVPAARTLGKIKDPRAVEPLISVLREFKDRHTQYFATLLAKNVAYALGEIGDKRAVEPLLESLGFSDYIGTINFRPATAGALLKINDPRIKPLLDAIKDGGTDFGPLSEEDVEIIMAGVKKGKNFYVKYIPAVTREEDNYYGEDYIGKKTMIVTSAKLIVTQEIASGQELEGRESSSGSVHLDKTAGLPITLELATGRISFGEGVVSDPLWERTLKDAGNSIADPSLIAKEPDRVIYYGCRHVRMAEDTEKINQLKLRYDITVLQHGTIGEEFVMTKGHRHGGENYPEIYEVLHGTALFLQQGINAKTGKMEVIATLAGEEEKVVLYPSYVHRAINIGDTPLVMTDWICEEVGGKEGGIPTLNVGVDFAKAESFHGFAYHVIQMPDGSIGFRPNRNCAPKAPKLKFAVPEAEIRIGDLTLSNTGPMYKVLDMDSAAGTLSRFLSDSTGFEESFEKSYKVIDEKEFNTIVAATRASSTGADSRIIEAREKAAHATVELLAKFDYEGLADRLKFNYETAFPEKAENPKDMERSLAILGAMSLIMARSEEGRVFLLSEEYSRRIPKEIKDKLAGMFRAAPPVQPQLTLGFKGLGELPDIMLSYYDVLAERMKNMKNESVNTAVLLLQQGGGVRVMGFPIDFESPEARATIEVVLKVALALKREPPADRGSSSGLNEKFKPLLELGDRAIGDGMTSVKISMRGNDDEVLYIDMDSSSRSPAIIRLRPEKRGGIGDIALHSACYKANPDINVIIQAHQPLVDTLISQGRTLPTLTPDFVALLNTNTAIPLIKNMASKENEVRLISGVLSPDQHNSVVFSQGRGILSTGSNLLTAFYRMRLVEETAISVITAEVMSGEKVKALPDGEPDRLLGWSGEKDRQKILGGEKVVDKPEVEPKSIDLAPYQGEIKTLRAQLAEIGREIAGRGLVVGPGGNISARTKDGQLMLVKASGYSFESMGPEDYVGIDLTTGQRIMGLGETKKPSVEYMSIHGPTYGVMDNIYGVVHVHSSVAAGMATAGKTFVLNDSAIPLTGYVNPGGEELANAVSKRIVKGGALLVGNHGTVNAGKTLRAALDDAIELENTAMRLAIEKAKTVDTPEARAFIAKLESRLGRPSSTGIRTNLEIFEDLSNRYDHARKDFVKAEREYPDNPRSVQPKRNVMDWWREELWMESEKHKIKFSQNKQGEEFIELADWDLLCDLITKRVFRYNSKEGLSLARIDKAKKGLLVKLTPLAISSEVRQKRDELKAKLIRDNEYEVRKNALTQLKKMEKEGLLPKPYPTPDAFIHCHTSISFGPSPEEAVWRSYQLGMGIEEDSGVVGLVDHNSNEGIRCWREACQEVGIKNFTAGVEVKVRLTGTRFENMAINFPGVKNVAYAVIHGVTDEGEIPWFNNMGIASIDRFKRIINFLNGDVFKKIHSLADINYERDVKPLTEKLANNPMDRHLAEAIAQMAIRTYGPAERVEFIQGLIDECAEKAGLEKRPLSDSEKSERVMNNPEELLKVIRARAIVPLYGVPELAPNDDECPHILNAIKFAHENGLEISYPCLGGGVNTCEAETPENIDELMAYLLEIEIDGIDYMPPRNTSSERRKYQKMARKFPARGAYPGMDVNEAGKRVRDIYMPGMAYTSEFSSRPELIKVAKDALEKERARRSSEARASSTGVLEEENAPLIMDIAPTASIMDSAHTVRDIIYPTGDEIRCMTEQRLGATRTIGPTEPMVNGQAHLVLVRSMVPQYHPTTLVNGYIMAWRSHFRRDGRYTVDVVDNLDKAIALLSGNKVNGWNKSNTIVGICADERNAFIARLEESGLTGMAKVLNLGTLGDGDPVPMSIYLNLMASVVNINGPLNDMEDASLIDRFRALFEYLDVDPAAIDRFIEDLKRADFTENGLFILDLPPIKPINIDNLGDFYELTEPVNSAA